MDFITLRQEHQANRTSVIPEQQKIDKRVVELFGLIDIVNLQISVQSIFIIGS